MADQPLLSALCSICNNNTPKYRCPGCAARTCSLPCYKRHQQRAQCDGKRDPTKYVKKNKLSTAAGVDHDFNFIAGIERGLDKADRLMEDSSIGVEERSSKTHAWNSNFAKRVREAGVIVERAPPGMSREKNNKTRINKKKHLVWTVEWIHMDDRRELGELSEMVPFSEAYRALVKQPPRPSKKRKLAVDALAEDSKETMDPLESHAESGPPELKSAATDKAAPLQPLGEPSEDAEQTCQEVSITSKEPNRQPETPHFYLVKHHTSSNRRVLIPVPSDAQLSTCLQNRIVLEFPSIYILPNPPDSLPPQFQLEADYVEQARKEQQELDELLASVQPPGGMPIADEDSTNPRTTSVAELDNKKILEVLRRDLGSRS